jgi:hypothetical protein
MSLDRFERHVQPSIRMVRRGRMRLYALPALGHMRLAEVRRRDVSLYIPPPAFSGFRPPANRSQPHRARMKHGLSLAYTD